VADNKSSPTEESGAVATAPVADTKEPFRGFLDLGRRNLSEEELQTAAVRRFLIADVEKAEAECVELRKVREAYWEQKTELASIKATLKTSRAFELMSFTCLTVGAAGMGAAISFITEQPEDAPGWVLLILSSLLTLAGILARFFK
jgi:hypothetical protein